MNTESFHEARDRVCIGIDFNCLSEAIFYQGALSTNLWQVSSSKNLYYQIYIWANVEIKIF